MTMQAATRGTFPCDQCGTPALRVVGATLVIEHRHHGQKHVTVVELAALLDRAEKPSV